MLVFGLLVGMAGVGLFVWFLQLYPEYTCPAPIISVTKRDYSDCTKVAVTQNPGIGTIDQWLCPNTQ